MDDWEIEYEWLRIRHFVKRTFRRQELPDLQALLFLIGVQEANVSKKTFTKEEKQDLMHVATCHLLSQEGLYEFLGKDADGWPHYDQVKSIPVKGLESQEYLLKECVINYFKFYEDSITEYEN